MKVALLSLLCLISTNTAYAAPAPERGSPSSRAHVHHGLATIAPRHAKMRERIRRSRPHIDRLATCMDEAPDGPRSERQSTFAIGAMTVYFWRDGAIYRLETKPDEVSDIALEPGEVLVSVAAGDTVRWIIGDTTSGTGATRRAHVLVKPSAAGLSTNLLIATDRRVYHVALESNAREGMSSIGWTYPEGELLALKRSAPPAREPAVSDGFTVERLNFNYSIQGDAVAWRPLRAFDDGHQVFIEFPPSIGESELPPLFILGEDGKAELVNYHVRGRYYLVDRLFDAAELRLGEKRQAVVRIVRDGSRARRRSS